MPEVFSFTTSLDHYEDNLYAYHFKVPDPIAKHFLSEKRSRIIATFNNQIKLHLALMPSGDERFLMVNQKTRKQLGIGLGDLVEITLQEDDSKYGMEFPVEMETVLHQEQPAFDIFESLTPGKQRTLIHLVWSVKNEQSRIRKSMAIAEHLVSTKGEIDFKILNETIKFYNKHR